MKLALLDSILYLTLILWAIQLISGLGFNFCLFCKLFQRNKNSKNSTENINSSHNFAHHHQSIISRNSGISNKQILVGVTLEYAPYIIKRIDENGSKRFTGLAIDLLDAIAGRIGFEYELYESPDGLAGHMEEDDEFCGMIGEVNASRADFAIGNIEIRPSYNKSVSFTTPILSNQHLVALVSRDHFKEFCTVEDLTENSTYGHQIGCLGLDCLELLAHNRKIHPTIVKLYQKVFGPPHIIETRELKQIFDRLKENKFALLLESNYAHYLASRNCWSAILESNHRIMERRHVAIPLAKGSQLLEPFNKAIKELQEDGTIQKLWREHILHSDCSNVTTVMNCA